VFDVEVLSALRASFLTTPGEWCGVIVRRDGACRFVALHGGTPDPAGFAVSGPALRRLERNVAEEGGRIVAWVHPHQHPSPPSPVDLASCDRTGVPWVVVSPVAGRLLLQVCFPPGEASGAPLSH
jgi:proteasome lid subunit RPN8/RPN11